MIIQDVFKGLQFVIDLPTSSSYREKLSLKKKITASNGIVSYIITHKTNFVIRAPNDESQSYRMLIAEKYGVQVVTPDFVDACLQRGKLVDGNVYLTCTKLKQQKNDFSDGKIFAKSKAKSQSVRLRLPSVKAWAYKDNRGPTFHNFPYVVVKAVVLKGKQKQKGQPFCIIEIHLTNDNHYLETSHIKFCLFTHNGILPSFENLEQYGKKTCRFLETSSDALHLFEVLYKLYVSPPYSMEHCSTFPNYAGLGSENFHIEDWLLASVLVEPQVAKFISDIWTEALYTLESTLSVPLKSIQELQVISGEGFLHEISKSLLDGDINRADKVSNDFYKVLPHRCQNSIKDWNMLTNEFCLCQLIRDMLMLQELVPLSDRNSIEQQYFSLSCDIRVLSISCPEYREVTSLINGTKEDLTFTIRNIFVVHRSCEDEDFAYDIGNKRSLFNGTKAEHFVGILSRGMLFSKQIGSQNINVSCDNILGPGLYFTDDVTAAVKYALPGKHNGTRHLLVSEVALGECFSTYSYNKELVNPPEGYNSIRGVKCREPEVVSDFEYNQYVVYHGSQQRLRYIIEFCLPDDTPTIKKLQPAVELHTTQVNPLEFFSGANKKVDESFTASSFDVEEFLLKYDRKRITTDVGLRSQANVAVPLKSLHVRAKLIDLAAEVVIMQEYYNDSPNIIEARYVFPLDDNAAVCGFEAFSNGQHFIGRIEEKKEAHKEYQEAMMAGQRTYLMDEEAPNVFKVSIGNVQPHSTVLVKIRYVAELELEDDLISFRLPSSLCPWQHQQVLESHPRTEQVVDICDSKNISTSVQLFIEMPFDIKRLFSPTHNIKIKKTLSKAVVSTDIITNRASIFQLLIGLSEIHVPRMWVEKHPDIDSSACMLTFYPEFLTDTKSNIEVILALDASHSMCGTSFEIAQQVALLCLHFLPPDAKFNVLTFGTIYHELFPTSQKKSLEKIHDAEQYILRSKPSFGSSRIDHFLLSYFTLIPQEDTLLNVFIITDGHLQRVDRVLSVAAKYNHTQLFTLGVGPYTNSHLLKRISHNGGGTCQFFDYSRKSLWLSKLKDQMIKAEEPVLTSVRVEWQQFNAGDSVLQAPQKLNAVFSGSRLTVYGFVPNCSLATLKALVKGTEITSTVFTSNLAESTGTTLHALTAKAVVCDWENGFFNDDRVIHEILKCSLNNKVIELSKQFNIITPVTSFVAVESKDNSTIKGLDSLSSIGELVKAEDVDFLKYIQSHIEGPQDRLTGAEESSNEVDYEPTRKPFQYGLNTGIRSNLASSTATFLEHKDGSRNDSRNHKTVYQGCKTQQTNQQQQQQLQQVKDSSEMEIDCDSQDNLCTTPGVNFNIYDCHHHTFRHTRLTPYLSSARHMVETAPKRKASFQNLRKMVNNEYSVQEGAVTQKLVDTPNLGKSAKLWQHHTSSNDLIQPSPFQPLMYAQTGLHIEYAPTSPAACPPIDDVDVTPIFGLSSSSLQNSVIQSPKYYPLSPEFLPKSPQKTPEQIAANINKSKGPSSPSEPKESTTQTTSIKTVADEIGSDSTTSQITLMQSGAGEFGAKASAPQVPSFKFSLNANQDTSLQSGVFSFRSNVYMPPVPKMLTSAGGFGANAPQNSSLAIGSSAGMAHGTSLQLLGGELGSKSGAVGFGATASTSGFSANAPQIPSFALGSSAGTTQATSLQSGGNGLGSRSGTIGFGATASTGGFGANAPQIPSLAFGSSAGVAQETPLQFYTCDLGSKSGAVGFGATASTGGFRANASTGGFSANARTGGFSANASTGGFSANASTGGFSANASTGGFSANVPQITSFAFGSSAGTAQETSLQSGGSGLGSRSGTIGFGATASTGGIGANAPQIPSLAFGSSAGVAHETPLQSGGSGLGSRSGRIGFAPAPSTGGIGANARQIPSLAFGSSAGTAQETSLQSGGSGLGSRSGTIGFGATASTGGIGANAPQIPSLAFGSSAGVAHETPLQSGGSGLGSRSGRIGFAPAPSTGGFSANVPQITSFAFGSSAGTAQETSLQSGGSGLGSRSGTIGFAATASTGGIGANAPQIPSLAFGSSAGVAHETPLQSGGSGLGSRSGRIGFAPAPSTGGIGANARQIPSLAFGSSAGVAQETPLQSGGSGLGSRSGKIGFGATASTGGIGANAPQITSLAFGSSAGVAHETPLQSGGSGLGSRSGRIGFAAAPSTGGIGANAPQIPSLAFGSSAGVAHETPLQSGGSGLGSRSGRIGFAAAASTGGIGENAPQIPSLAFGSSTGVAQETPLQFYTCDLGSKSSAVGFGATASTGGFGANASTGGFSANASTGGFSANASTGGVSANAPQIPSLAFGSSAGVAQETPLQSHEGELGSRCGIVGSGALAPQIPVLTFGSNAGASQDTLLQSGADALGSSAGMGRIGASVFTSRHDLKSNSSLPLHTRSKLLSVFDKSFQQPPPLAQAASGKPSGFRFECLLTLPNSAAQNTVKGAGLEIIRRDFSATPSICQDASIQSCQSKPPLPPLTSTNPLFEGFGGNFCSTSLAQPILSQTVADSAQFPAVGAPATHVGHCGLPQQSAMDLSNGSHVESLGEVGLLGNNRFGFSSSSAVSTASNASFGVTPFPLFHDSPQGCQSKPPVPPLTATNSLFGGVGGNFCSTSLTQPILSQTVTGSTQFPAVDIPTTHVGHSGVLEQSVTDLSTNSHVESLGKTGLFINKPFEFSSSLTQPLMKTDSKSSKVFFGGRFLPVDPSCWGKTSNDELQEPAGDTWANSSTFGVLACLDTDIGEHTKDAEEHANCILHSSSSKVNRRASHDCIKSGSTSLGSGLPFFSVLFKQLTNSDLASSNLQRMGKKINERILKLPNSTMEGDLLCILGQINFKGAIENSNLPSNWNHDLWNKIQEKLLDNGLKSMGSVVENVILNQVATLGVLFAVCRKLHPAIFPLNLSSSEETIKQAYVMVNILKTQLSERTLLAFLLCLVYITTVNQRHPLVYRSLELGSSWEEAFCNLTAEEMLLTT